MATESEKTAEITKKILRGPRQYRAFRSPRVYEGQSKLPDGTLQKRWFLDHIDHGGKRRRPSFRSLGEARRALSFLNQKIHNEGVRSLAIPDTVRNDAVWAMERLAGTGADIRTAVEFFISQRPKAEPKSFAEATDAYIQDHLAQKCLDTSVRAMQSLFPYVAWGEAKGGGKIPAGSRELGVVRGRSLRVGKGLGDLAMHEITTDTLEKWMRTQTIWGDERWNGVLKLLRALWKFSQEKGWVPKDYNPAKGISRRKLTRGDITFLTVDQVDRLLKTIQKEYPAILVGAALQLFAGLRRSELLGGLRDPQKPPLPPLDWTEITDHVIISAERSKTRTRRIIPVQPVLEAWLRPFRISQGPVVAIHGSNYDFALTNAAKRAGTIVSLEDGDEGKKEKNVIRHSFCSYHLARWNDIGRTAKHAGNTPEIIEKHYAAAVSEAAAEAYWQIFPDSNGLPATDENQFQS